MMTTVARSGARPGTAWNLFRLPITNTSTRWSAGLGAQDTSSCTTRLFPLDEAFCGFKPPLPEDDGVWLLLLLDVGQ